MLLLQRLCLSSSLRYANVPRHHFLSYSTSMRFIFHLFLCPSLDIIMPKGPPGLHFGLPFIAICLLASFAVYIAPEMPSKEPKIHSSFCNIRGNFPAIIQKAVVSACISIITYCSVRTNRSLNSEMNYQTKKQITL